MIQYAIEGLEWLAGKCLVWSFQLRHRRMMRGDLRHYQEDSHEVKHLVAALTMGNSDECRGGLCRLNPPVYYKVTGQRGEA